MTTTTTKKPEGDCSTTNKADACSTTASKQDAGSTTTGKPKGCGNTHDGKLVSISGNKLVMSGRDGKAYTHTVAADAKVCCDGTTCRTADLKPGAKIRLTTKADDKQVATKIESLCKKTEFATPC